MSTNENAEMELLLTIEHKKQELSKAQEAHANYLKLEEEMRKINEHEAKIASYANQIFKRLPTQEKTELYMIYECTPEGKEIVGFETTVDKAHQVIRELYYLSQKYLLKKNFEIEWRPISNYNTIFDLCLQSFPDEPTAV